MSEYKLYCFAQSGNAYRGALMLNLIGAKWEPVWVDFFKGGETRTPKYRETVNEMGEVPVLVHGNKKLSQSCREERKIPAAGRRRTAGGVALDDLRQSEDQRLSGALPFFA